MFYKNVLSSAGSVSPQQISENTPRSTPRLILVPPGGGTIPKKSQSPFFDLLVVAAPRCASFFAEAAVLVLVLAVLDRFMMKGRMEVGWVASAFGISFGLLAVSIVTDLCSRRWLAQH